jgi:hypothetical protein
LAAEQAAGREIGQVHDHPPAPHLPEVLSTPVLEAPPLAAAQPPSLAELWHDVLAGLRLRLPREVYQACARQATLIGYADGIATIGVSDVRLKNTLEHGYLGTLRFAFDDALGREVEVRVVIDNRQRVYERDRATSNVTQCFRML